MNVMTTPKVTYTNEVWHVLSKMYPLCPQIALIHTLSMGQQGTLPGIEMHMICFVFVYGDGLRW